MMPAMFTRTRPIEGAPSLALDSTSLALDYERIRATRQIEILKKASTLLDAASTRNGR